MDQFKPGDQVVIVAGEFDGQQGYVDSLIETVNQLKVILNNTGYAIFVGPEIVRKQQ